MAVYYSYTPRHYWVPDIYHLHSLPKTNTTRIISMKTYNYESTLRIIKRFWSWLFGAKKISFLSSFFFDKDFMYHFYRRLQFAAKPINWHKRHSPRFWK